MILGTIIACVFGLIVFVYCYVRYKFTYFQNLNILHIKPTFPFGNMKGAGTSLHIAFILKNIYDEFVGKDVLVGFYFFTAPGFVVMDPELNKKILVKDFNYFTDRKVYYNEKDDPLSGHLFALEGNKWKNLRAKLTPTFTSGKMKMMFNTILSVADEFNILLKPMAEAGEIIEIKDIFARFTTDIIGSCAFGLECNSIANPNAEFRVMGRKFFNPPKIRQPIMFFCSLFPDFSRKIGLKFTDSEVSEFFLRIVKEAIDYREQNKVGRKDFLQLLINLKNSENFEDKLTFNEIAAQCFIFFLAGFETSSSTMTFCLYELAKNQEIQEKVRSEIKSVLANYDGKITYEAMMELPYLEMVINETLRKYPSVDNLFRIAGKDYFVEGTNYKIDKGKIAIIPVYAIHHDPKIYPEPDKFDPERFTAKNIQSRNPYTYLPFGEGPRACIGIRFGMMQTKVGIVSMLMNYKLTTTEQTTERIDFQVTSMVMTAKDGVYLKIESL